MTNRALLVGINDYPSAPLRGCINDVVDISEFVVQKCGFKPDDVRTLTDAQATTAAIKEALSGWLVRGAAEGDRLLFHFSGHGSLLPYRDGNVHDVICPVDFDFTEPRSLSDEDFRMIFAPVPAGAQFNWISDSCHSGDLARTVRPDVRPRYLPPPPEIQQEIARLRARRAETRSLSRAMDRLNGALIAGCQSDEESADASFGNRPNGALTYYLLKELGGPTGLSDPLDTVVKNVVTVVQANGYRQRPQLRGLPQVRGRPFLSASGGWQTVGMAQGSAAAGAAEATSAQSRATGRGKSRWWQIWRSA